MVKNAHVLLDISKLKVSVELVMLTLSILEKTVNATLDFTEMEEKNVINVTTHAVNALVLKLINAQCAQMSASL